MVEATMGVTEEQPHDYVEPNQLVGKGMLSSNDRSYNNGDKSPTSK